MGGGDDQLPTTNNNRCPFAIQFTSTNTFAKKTIQSNGGGLEMKSKSDDRQMDEQMMEMQQEDDNNNNNNNDNNCNNDDNDDGHPLPFEFMTISLLEHETMEIIINIFTGS